jgi:hypothetical protein
LWGRDSTDSFASNEDGFVGIDRNRGKDRPGSTQEGRDEVNDARDQPRQREAEEFMRDFPARLRELVLDSSISAELDQERAQLEIAYGRLVVLLGDQRKDHEAIEILNDELVSIYLKEGGDPILLFRTLEEAPGRVEQTPSWVGELRNELLKETALDSLKDHGSDALPRIAEQALDAALAVPTGPIAAPLLVRRLLKK